MKIALAVAYLQHGNCRDLNLSLLDERDDSKNLGSFIRGFSLRNSFAFFPENDFKAKSIVIAEFDADLTKFSLLPQKKTADICGAKMELDTLNKLV